MKFSNYKEYKPALRKEFLYSCGYCENREPELGGSEAFHIDHYKPKKKFPHLICKYTNLIYACRYCNRYKSDYWPSYAQRVLGRIILNPRNDSFDQHVDRSGFAWVGKTAKGKWTVLRLRLDSPAFIQRRENRRLIEKAIARLENILADSKKCLENAIAQRVGESEVQIIRSDIASLINEIAATRQSIIGQAD